MKKTKKITKNQTIVESIPEGVSDYTYIVGRSHTFSLVLIADKNTHAEVKATVRLAGRGAQARIIGIVLGGDASTIKIHTLQIHEAPDTTSDLMVKTVLRDHAKCIYDGGIRVEKNAQKTNAYQRNENLLLSAHAYAESKPSLEILANDVRCTHGATAGPIDEEQLWYLSTRGIMRSQGERLIASGFIQSALERIDDAGVRSSLQKRFANGV